jgi:hypothetical protein
MEECQIEKVGCHHTGRWIDSIIRTDEMTVMRVGKLKCTFGRCLVAPSEIESHVRIKSTAKFFIMTRTGSAKTAMLVDKRYTRHFRWSGSSDAFARLSKSPSAQNILPISGLEDCSLSFKCRDCQKNDMKIRDGSETYNFLSEVSRVCRWQKFS